MNASRPFSPSLPLRNKHVQTILAVLPTLSPYPRGSIRDPIRFPLRSNRGDLWGLAAWHPNDVCPTAIFAHGLGGSHRDGFLLRTTKAFYTAGFNTVSLDLRGVGRSRETTRTLGHAGLTDDMADVIESVVKDPRVLSVVTVGFSLGGQMALKLASEWGPSPPPYVRAVVALSAPMDLDATSKALTRPEALPYHAVMLASCLHSARLMAQIAPGSVPFRLRDLPKLRTLRAFDDRIIAPMHGFASAEDYYAKASCGPHLGAITVPTLCIHAQDDPIVPFDSLVPYIAQASERVEFIHQRHGGHLGFVEHLWPFPVTSWLSSEAVQFAKDCVGPTS